ncbi:hypothetical protein FQN57_003765 [Myotisia sp. PD_48]|nr:hypothetical protein FQN57_003765 [Myotisia sp. PD_48]
MSGKEDPLAYGHYSGDKQDQSERAAGDGSTRSLLGNTLRTFRDKYSQSQQQPPLTPQGGAPPNPPYQGYNQAPPPSTSPAPGQQGYPQYGNDPTHAPNPQYYGAGGNTGASSQNTENKPPKGDFVSGLFGKIQGIGSEVAQRIGSNIDPHGYATYGSGGSSTTKHRYASFAPQRNHNDAKWYVDGCSYMWAVSRALETAKEYIWILDWWLSPELYLRRPPGKNEQYRIDRMLLAAAQRGVKIDIIVYKEVTQALSLSSSHTKHHLQDLHPNIAVLRHPDHLPDRQTIHSSVMSSFKNLTLNPAGIAKLSGDAIKGIYGMHEGVILYWAHHEKLCIVDGRVAFMGGLDLSFGRWDTYQHSIADAHPTDLTKTVFPGQDYNNARILDFQDVVNWEKNELDRKTSSRMGWTDVAVSLHGPVVEDLRKHFVDRWNYIYDEKYAVRKDVRHSKLVLYPRVSSRPTSSHFGQPHSSGSPQSPAGAQGYQQTQIPPPYGGGALHSGTAPPGSQSSGGYQSQEPYFPPPPSGQPGQYSQARGFEEHDQYQSRAGGSEGQSLRSEFSNFGNLLRTQLAGQVHRYQDRYFSGQPGQPQGAAPASVNCQIVRSISKWSDGTETEHSIMDAYVSIIRESEHFVYIENQFFITATSDAQKPVKNKIGAAITERILRAARAGQKYKMIVVIPAIPGFPGDLRDDGSLGTRAIMEFQYNSINRGGNSIMEVIAREGFNPMDYIRFYNLRNYDRINVSAAMRQAEQQSGVNYEAARHQYDSALTGSGPPAFDTTTSYPQYQRAAQQVAHGQQSSASGRWDSVSECYMLGGEDIRNVPWEHPEPQSEIDAYVTEELYVHSKVLIADDRTVICGSANLNDRSQLGFHDSEIAVIIQDPAPLETTMNGQQYVVSRFAATLRRQLCRKHLGLIRPQDYQHPDANFEPVGVPNQYDWNSAEDRLVADPISDSFLSLWNMCAKQNTEVFRKVFHAVPDDTVRNWNDYKEFYEYYFRKPEDEKQEEAAQGQPLGSPAPRYLWGHVIRDEFPDGVRAVKEELSKVRGTLVEMPLMFLVEEDIAQEGLGLNSLTEELYT